MQLRTKRVTLEPELVHWRKGMKLTSAAFAVLSALSEQGIRSSAFTEAFDHHVTLANFEPLVKMRWPSVIVFAHHRITIRSTEDLVVILITHR